MNSKHFLSLVLVAALAGTGGWFLSAHQHHPPAAADANAPSGKIYSCSMHPQIRSNKPGRCPICLMELAPIGSGASAAQLPVGSVQLSASVINVINVQTVEVKRQPLSRSLRVAGVIDDNDTRHRRLSAYVDGRIEKLFINFIGAEVTAGQPLATFYSPMLLAMEREYAALRQQKPARDATGLLAEHQRLVDAAVQRLKLFGLNDAQIAALENKSSAESTTELLAPMAGTVITREVYEGQYVKEGERLFELADFSKMWFRFDAYERDLAWIKPGQLVDVTTPAAPGKVFTAPITFIEPNLDDKTRSAKVRVELENPLVERDGKMQRELYHRLYAEGVVKIEVPEVLTVPRSAVLSPTGQPVVYVDQGGGIYEQRKLKLGRAGDELWEVLEGLKEGDFVVTAGNLLIDAQAQLNSGTVVGHQHGGETNTTAPLLKPSAALTGAQQTAAQDFIAVAAALDAALAKSSVAEFNQAAAKLHAVVPALTKAFADAPDWQPLILPLERVGHLAVASDIKAARKAFVPFTAAAVEFARNLRAHEAGFKALKIYECPMVNMSFPGAPKTSRWLQTQGPLRNPFLAPEMIDCGTEIKP